MIITIDCEVFSLAERNLNPKAACIKKREEDKSGSSSSMQGTSSGGVAGGAGHSQVRRTITHSM